jgi:hypothetical protein
MDAEFTPGYLSRAFWGKGDAAWCVCAFDFMLDISVVLANGERVTERVWRLALAHLRETVFH